jgi:hypothetical protein
VPFAPMFWVERLESARDVECVPRFEHKMASRIWSRITSDGYPMAARTTLDGWRASVQTATAGLITRSNSIMSLRQL